MGRREPEISADHAYLKLLPSSTVQEKTRQHLKIVAEPALPRGAPTLYGVDNLEQELHVVAAGHVVSVTGMNLTFDRSFPDKGVWFAPPDSAKEPSEIAKDAVRADLYTRTGSNHVHCRVPPSLAPGRYRLLVSSRRHVRRPDKPPKLGGVAFFGGGCGG